MRVWVALHGKTERLLGRAATQVFSRFEPACSCHTFGHVGDASVILIESDPLEPWELSPVQRKIERKTQRGANDQTIWCLLTLLRTQFCCCKLLVGQFNLLSFGTSLLTKWHGSQHKILMDVTNYTCMQSPRPERLHCPVLNEVDLHYITPTCSVRVSSLLLNQSCGSPVEVKINSLNFAAKCWVILKKTLLWEKLGFQIASFLSTGKESKHGCHKTNKDYCSTIVLIGDWYMANMLNLSVIKQWILYDLIGIFMDFSCWTTTSTPWSWSESPRVF